MADPPATISAIPDGKANSESAAIRKPDPGIGGLGRSVICLANMPMGIRIIITRIVSAAIFQPLFYQL